MQWWPLAFHDHNMLKTDLTCARVPLSPVPPPPVTKGLKQKNMGQKRPMYASQRHSYWGKESYSRISISQESQRKLLP